MASAIGATRSGGRRSLDAEVNLVPFIDLLSMCICFLLMTAVWVQMGSLQVKQSHGTAGAAPDAASLEMGVKFSGTHQALVSVKRGGKELGKVEVAANEPALFFTRLDAAVQQLGKGATISAAMITPATGVDYGELVGALDVLRKNRITNLGVVPVSGR